MGVALEAEDFFRFLFEWSLESEHLLLIAVALFIFLLLHHLLNYKSPERREHERVVRNLVEGSVGKYSSLRPLH